MYTKLRLSVALALLLCVLLCAHANPTRRHVGRRELTKATESQAAPPNTILEGSRSARIFNGYSNMEGYPWLAMLFYSLPSGSTPLICGATIISRSWGMTAAHCVFNMTSSRLFLVYGETNLLTEIYDMQVVNISRTIVHPSYKERGLEAMPGVMDVALLRLAHPINATRVELNTGTRLEKAGTQLTTAGWGDVGHDYIHNMTVAAYELQEAKAEPLTTAECEERGAPSVPQHVCAGTDSGDVTICPGDSGGPLHHTNGPAACQVGIASLSAEGSCDASYPHKRGMTFQKLSSVYSWVSQYVKNAKACQ